MAVVRLTGIPANRREIYVEWETEVRGFRAATAEIARDLRQTATHDFRNMVMRLWAEHGKSGGFAVKEKHGDSWWLFEYSEGK